MNDAELSARVQAGDNYAFERIYVEHRNAVRGATRRFRKLYRCGHDDVEQETWLTALRWLRAGSYDPNRGSLRTWLLNAAMHTVSELGKSKKLLRTSDRALRLDDPEMPDITAGTTSLPFDHVLLGEVIRIADATLKRMPPRDRMITTMMLGGVAPKYIGWRWKISRQRAYQITDRVLDRIRVAL